MATNSLSESHTDSVCLKGKGEKTCSFLMFGGSGWECSKGGDMEQFIRSRRDDKSMKAMGDNCSGPPSFTPQSS
jgi:hypothetical protein